MSNEIMYTDFMMYDTGDGMIVKVILGDETVWMTQSGIAELFEKDISNISRHISNIFSEGELQEEANLQKMQIGLEDKKTAFYSLDVIISVGYRVSSQKATKFRIRANKILKEYLIKGYVLDKDRLKQGGQYFGKDYFQELLEEIREIRSSERLFYRKLTDIFALSEDYDASSKLAHDFFSTIQNKMHFAAHQHTGAEVIAERANYEKPNMGLTSWKNQKKGGKIVKSDIEVAKNYLTKDELSDMNHITTMLLDFAEGMARRKKIMKMADWIKKIDEFLKFNEYHLLDGPGKVSSDYAKSLASAQYDSYRAIQDKEYISDFDNFVEESKNIYSHKEEDLSDFNKKLKQGLDYNPNDYTT